MNKTSITGTLPDHTPWDPDEHGAHVDIGRQEHRDTFIGLQPGQIDRPHQLLTLFHHNLSFGSIQSNVDDTLPLLVTHPFHSCNKLFIYLFIYKFIHQQHHNILRTFQYSEHLFIHFFVWRRGRFVSGVFLNVFMNVLISIYLYKLSSRSFSRYLVTVFI